MSMSSCYSTTSCGSSAWQSSAGKDQFHHQVIVASAEDHHQHQTWRAVASRLAIDNQLRNITERHEPKADEHEEEEYYYRNINFNNNNMPLKFLEMKGSQHRSIYVQQSSSSTHDKWHKTLPQAEMLPRNEVLGGYIFVCNNETMQEDLHRQLFGLPQKYKDSVRAITPGLPLFLYNYTSHQLHGVFQAVTFGGSNIDPTAWEDKKCKGESRFPAQVRIRVKERCKPLQEDAFRPILYHYDGPKFRLQLSVPEALALLDLFKEENP